MPGPPESFPFSSVNSVFPSTPRQLAVQPWLSWALGPERAAAGDGVGRLVRDHMTPVRRWGVFVWQVCEKANVVRRWKLQMRQKRSLCSGMSPASSPLRLTVCCSSFLFFSIPASFHRNPGLFLAAKCFPDRGASFYLRSRGVRRRTAVLSPRSFLIIKRPQTSPFHHRPPSNIRDTAFGVSTALTKKKMYGFKKVLYCEKGLTGSVKPPERWKVHPLFIYFISWRRLETEG